MIAALLLVLAAASAAEPTGTLTLACEGTAADKTDLIREAARPEPVSMGLIIDFTTKTIAGFERVFPSFVFARLACHRGTSATLLGFVVSYFGRQFNRGRSMNQFVASCLASGAVASQSQAAV
jgi:hypothetical protein